MTNLLQGPLGLVLLDPGQSVPASVEEGLSADLDLRPKGLHHVLRRTEQSPGALKLVNNLLERREDL